MFGKIPWWLVALLLGLGGAASGYPDLALILLLAYWLIPLEN